MIKEFNPVEVNKQGKIYVETFEQIKLIHEKDQELARELAIAAIEKALTGQISSDNVAIEALLLLIQKQTDNERICPISISKGQNRIRDILFNNNISFKQEYAVAHLGRFDFAVFDESGLSYLIEYDGEQHFKSVDCWGGEKGLMQRKEKDNRKNQWAKEHNIPLIRIPYTLKDVHLRDLVPKTSKYVWAS